VESQEKKIITNTKTPIKSGFLIYNEMNNYIEIIFHAVTVEQSEILIAQLSEEGFEGFEENENELKAFIPKTGYDVHVINEIAKRYDIHFSQYEVKQENWNQLWESNFQPVVVNDFAAVRAEFHPHFPNVKHEITITPKMSFGTGHHATTRMMMEQMSEIDFAGKMVFDFGTGTGILAILAEKLGAKGILAIDNDDWSIENARENFKMNNCTVAKIVKADSADQHQRFDIILANIVKNVILANMDFMVGSLNKGGVLLLSGLLPEDEADILECAKKRSLIVDKKTQQNQWLCLRFLY